MTISGVPGRVGRGCSWIGLRLSRWPWQRKGQDRAASGIGAELDRPTARLDGVADVSQAGASSSVCAGSNPSAVVLDAHGEHPAVVVQSERRVRRAARVFCDVLDRLRTRKYAATSASLGAARRCPCRR